MPKKARETTSEKQVRAEVLPKFPTHESTSYLMGVFNEFHKQVKSYQDLTGELLSLEARVELAEKMLCLARDHFEMTVKQTESAFPNDWERVFRSVRFVGVRLAVACADLLKEKKKMTLQELLDGLNAGMFRFRTNAPMREIHAALLRQPSVKKTGGTYVWKGEGDQMKFRVVRKRTRPSLVMEKTS